MPQVIIQIPFKNMPVKRQADKEQRLRQILDERGCHFTHQRAAVFNYLSNVDHHPTAEEVFLAVKPKLPKISLATVYKNLEALVECGAASKFTYGDSSARYDIRTDHHYHTRCLKCGGVSDLEASEGDQFLRQIKPRAGFEVKDYRLELIGYCSDCRRQ
jgi:Fe2+ or Zn2+ uptake regulation protein